MNRYVLPITLSIVMGCGSAMAQLASPTDAATISPLGMTSPLGLNPGSPVAPTGIPMGAIELATPGISPSPDMSATTGMPVFDGGGMAALATTPTTPPAPAPAPTPMSPALTVGRLGIPLGSVELGGGGLSPPPDPTTAFVPPLAPAAPSAFVAPTVAAPTAMSPPPTACVMSRPSPGAATAPGGC